MNPYAPPNPPPPDDSGVESVAGALDLAGEVEGAGTRRKRRKKRGGYTARIDKELLVLSRDAVLPGVCLKCGSHHDLVRRRAKFQWSPTWARILVLFCAVFGMLALAFTTNRAELSVPLCRPCNKRWTMGRVALLVSGVAFGVVLVGIRFTDDPRMYMPLLGVVLVTFVVVAIAFARPRMIQAKKIDDENLELGGIHPNAAQEIAEGSRP